MHPFRFALNSALRAAWVAVICLGLALPAAAQAPPEPLTPVPSASQPAPSLIVPVTPLGGGFEIAPLTASQPAPPASVTQSQRAGPITVGELEELDPSVAGLLDDSNGGLGVNMWQGSNRARIERLLPRLPMGTLSPAIQDLARRLLLSTAAVPEGEAVAPSLLGLRVERLMAGGHIRDVNELLHLAAAPIDDPALSQAAVDAMLLAENYSGACARVADLVLTDRRSYWIKTLAFCRALDDDSGAVSLALALLRDQGQVGDDAFFTLIALLSAGEGDSVTTLIDPSPLHFAMLRAAQQQVPVDAVVGARPAILHAIATAPNDSLAVRLEAGERAEAAGALATPVLREIYEAVPYTSNDVAVALQTARTDSGAMVHALLYQAASVWDLTGAKATVLQRALQKAREDGTGFGTVARVNLPLLRGVAPGSDLTWFVFDASRALLGAGDIAAAWDWLDVALAAAEGGDEHSEETAAALWPLMQIADPEGAFMRNPARARAWWRDLPLPEDAAASERRALLFTLYEALGDPMPDEAWDPLFAAPLTVTSYMPSPAVLHALRDASADGRVGETVLLTLLALGDIGSEGADPATLFEVIGALAHIGLEHEARDVALEAALARGL